MRNKPLFYINIQKYEISNIHVPAMAGLCNIICTYHKISEKALNQEKYEIFVKNGDFFTNPVEVEKS